MHDCRKRCCRMSFFNGFRYIQWKRKRSHVQSTALSFSKHHFMGRTLDDIPTFSEQCSGLKRRCWSLWSSHFL